MDQSSSTQNRRSRRSNVLLAATLEAGETTMPVRLRNLSAEGALVQGAKLPAPGEHIQFRRNDLSVAGRVAWVHGELAGIAFGEELQPEEVLRNVPLPRRKMPMSFRRPGLAAQELTDDEKRMLERYVRPIV